MASPIKSSMERGLPISLSRWTDVAHWYMPWLKEMIVEKKIIPASDPQTLTLSFWDVDPEQVHSLFFWTKYPPKLTEAIKTWLGPYRIYSAITITGWQEVETRVPPLKDQLHAFHNHMGLVGPEKMRWRYSPVPNDFLSNPVQRARFDTICSFMSVRGFTEVDVSLLQPSPHWNKGYAIYEGQTESEARRLVLLEMADMASKHGISLGVCSDDMRTLVETGVPNGFETRCLNRAAIDKVFGMETPQINENGCGCQLSLDPCQGKQFGCASGCQYCYVPFTKVPKEA